MNSRLMSFFGYSISSLGHRSPISMTRQLNENEIEKKSTWVNG